MTVVLVALGAAAGAALRYVVAEALDSRLPWGTLAVNVVGSLLLGLLSGGLATGASSYALVGIGFCGGLTTYSAFSVQTYDLGPRAGSAYAGLTVVLSLAACALGFALAQA